MCKVYILWRTRLHGLSSAREVIVAPSGLHSQVMALPRGVQVSTQACGKPLSVLPPSSGISPPPEYALHASRSWAMPVRPHVSVRATCQRTNRDVLCPASVSA